MSILDYIIHYSAELLKARKEEQNANTDEYANIKHVDAERIAEIIEVLEKLESDEIKNVIITKCSYRGFWYNDKIGKVFSVREYPNNQYIIAKDKPRSFNEAYTSPPSFRLILKRDCKII